MKRAAEAESRQLLLSAGEHRTLGDRHTQLVASLTAACVTSLKARDFDVLQLLSQLLESVQALDVFALAVPTAAVHITDGPDHRKGNSYFMSALIYLNVC